MRLVADLLAGLPAVEHVGEAEEAPHHARFGMLSGTAEEVVVVEIEIDDVAVAVDRDAGNVVAEIAIPVDAKPARIGHHLAAVACRRVRHLLAIDLARPQRIGAERAALVAVPEPDDQLHQEIAIDPVALLDRIMAELGGILGDVDADVDEVAQLPVPVVDQGLLGVESRRRRQQRLRRGRRQHGPRQRARRAGDRSGGGNEVPPVDLVVIAHRSAPCIENPGHSIGRYGAVGGVI